MSDEKTCPYCAETIKAAAIKCRYCGSDLSVLMGPGDFLPLEPRLQDWHSLAPMDEGRFQTELISKEPRPIYGSFGPLDNPFGAWEVTGGLTNTDDQPSSYVLNVFGIREGDPSIVVCKSDTETQIVAPGKSCEWSLRLMARVVAPPVRLQYHIQRQAHPGDIGLDRSVDEALRLIPESGPMVVSLLQRMALEAAALEQAQLDRFLAAQVSAPPGSSTALPVKHGWRLPAEQSGRGVCPTCLKEKRLTSQRQLIASHVFNGEKCKGSGVEPTRITKAVDVLPVTPVRPVTPAPPKTASLVREEPKPIESERPSRSTSAHTSAQVGKRHSPSESERPSIPEGTPVLAWRGARRMVTSDVNCTCTACRHQWFVPAEIANALAQLQSISGRLERWGKKTQNVGNIMTPGIGTLLAGRSGRQVATQRDFDMAIKAEFRCQKCGSSSVLISSDRATAPPMTLGGRNSDPLLGQELTPGFEPTSLERIQGTVNWANPNGTGGSLQGLDGIEYVYLEDWIVSKEHRTLREGERVTFVPGINVIGLIALAILPE